MKTGAYVVVTTEWRGVFAGVVVKYEAEARRITLGQARGCVYWSAETRGVVGLAVTGPQDGSRVGPPAPEAVLYGVTAVMAASPASRKAWESGPWS